MNLNVVLIVALAALFSAIPTSRAAQCPDAMLPQFTTVSNVVKDVDDCLDLMLVDGQVYGDCWYAPCIAMDFPTGSSYWEVVNLPASVGTTGIEAKGATGIGMFMTETLDVSDLMMVRRSPLAVTLPLCGSTLQCLDSRCQFGRLCVRACVCVCFHAPGSPHACFKPSAHSAMIFCDRAGILILFLLPIWLLYHFSTSKRSSLNWMVGLRKYVLMFANLNVLCSLLVDLAAVVLVACTPPLR